MKKEPHIKTGYVDNYTSRPEAVPRPRTWPALDSATMKNYKGHTLLNLGNRVACYFVCPDLDLQSETIWVSYSSIARCHFMIQYIEITQFILCLQAEFPFP